MPIEGLPDPDQHKFCIRCRKWCYPDEGSVIDVTPARVGDAFLPISVQPHEIRFVCLSCQSRRLHWRIIVFGVLAILLLLCGAAKLMGWL